MHEKIVDPREAGIMEKFRPLQSLEYFTREVNNPERFFQEPKKRLTCIDEGICEGLHIAGSGIMESSAEIDRIIQENGILEIESHEGCGAAALEADVRSETDSESFAIRWAKETAQRNGIKYSGHRKLAEMCRPALYHNAQVCYYDGTGKFNRLDGSELPSGFTISRTLSPKVGTNVELAERIAYGPHGLAEYFTPDHPFVFVILGNPEDPNLNFETLSQEVVEIVRKSSGRAIVDGFDVPVGWLDS